MTFQQNKKAYSKKCDKLSLLFLNYAYEFKALSESIKQHGITEDTRKFIDKRYNKLMEGVQK